MKTYTNPETGQRVKLTQDENANLVLLDENNNVIKLNFYCCVFTSTELKLKDGSIIKLNVSEFYTWSDESKKPIKRRFTIQGLGKWTNM